MSKSKLICLQYFWDLVLSTARDHHLKVKIYFFNDTDIHWLMNFFPAREGFYFERHDSEPPFYWYMGWTERTNRYLRKMRSEDLVFYQPE